jgi:hypothetical protein
VGGSIRWYERRECDGKVDLDGMDDAGFRRNPSLLSPSESASNGFVSRVTTSSQPLNLSPTDSGLFKFSSQLVLICWYQSIKVGVDIQRIVNDLVVVCYRASPSKLIAFQLVDPTCTRLCVELHRVQSVMVELTTYLSKMSLNPPDP